MKPLFDSAPCGKYATAYTVVASLLLHGSLVGVAALWPSQPEPAKIIVTLIGDAPSEPAPSNIPDVPPPVATVDEVIAPTTQPEVMTDPLPTLEEPQITEHESPKIVIKHAQPPKSPSHALTSTSSRVSNSPYQITASAGSGLLSLKARWNVSSIPPYPFALRRAQTQGSGSVRITTDASGHVESAVIVRSTGNSALDDNTCRHAKAAWSGPSNASLVVPVTYRIQ